MLFWMLLTLTLYFLVFSCTLYFLYGTPQYKLTEGGPVLIKDLHDASNDMKKQF